MTNVFQIAFLSAICFGLGSISLGSETERDYFVFLTTGKTTQGVAPEDIQKKQAAHLENFGRLAKLGALTVAGPCSDPDKMTRGIVVINADSIADAEAMFGPDPYVSEGFMKAELNGYRTVAGKLQLVTEVISMEQSVLVILTQGDKWQAEPSTLKSVEDQLSKLAKEQHELNKLGFAGLFNAKSNNTSKRVAVMLFHGKELEPVKAILESQALVRNGTIQFKAFPQYMAKGALPSKEER
jgi:uncharacterized protein YciI